MNFCVVTTINKPTKAIEILHELFGDRLIVVGDKKTPADWNYKDVVYIPFVEKEKGWFEGYDPTNHYARKNIGYLQAIKCGATSILEADDDSYPLDKWKMRDNETEAKTSVGDGWFNMYAVFSDHKIWPRGFPLKLINKIPTIGNLNKVKSSIQQFLVDGDPDVDAIWRLILKSDHSFLKNESVYLNNQSWCPFNSQATLWFPDAYPLLYLPIYATFRMCDIWRSFIAQRCLREINDTVTFHSPSEFFQDRNEHDLLSDFKDEIDGYLYNEKIVNVLSDLQLIPGIENVCNNLIRCYEEICNHDLLPQNEVRCVRKWVKAYQNILSI